MLSRDARESTFFSQSFLFGAMAFFMAVISLYSFGLYIIRLNAEPVLTFDLDRWAWLGDIEIGLKKGDGIPSTQPSSFTMDDSSFLISFENPSEAQKSLNAEFNLARVTRKLDKVSSNNKSSRHLPTPTHLKQSHGIQFLQELGESETIAHMNEPKKMQKLHQALVRQISVAMSTQMNIHSSKNKRPVVATAANESEFEYSIVSTHLIDRGPATVRDTPRINNSDIELKLKEAGQKVDDILRLKTSFLNQQYHALSHSLSQGAQGVRGSAPFGYLSSAVTEGMPSQLRTSKVLLSKNEYSSNRLNYESRGYPQSSPAVAHSSMNIQIQRSDVQALAMMLANEAKMNTQGPTSSPWEKFQNMIETTGPEFREAFTHDQMLTGVQSDVITSEESGVGWRSYRLNGFWPTVTRVRPRQRVPLLSENSAQLLALTTGSRIQKSAGIVFGKIPPGWTVTLSGRSERGVYLNSDDQPVSPFSVEGERSFVFVNAAPGSQLLILKGHSVNDQGIVAIPVLAGQATQIDLTRLTFRKLAGFVYNAESNEPYPLAGVQVRLSGTSGLDVLTGSDGYFEIPEVLTVSDYPVYLETDQAGGFTHRYEISPDNIDNAILYRLGNQQISDWVDQLEGGVSAESALAVVAVPTAVIEQVGGRKLRPRVSSLLDNPSLIPETYTISPSGELKVQRSIYSKLPRFVSVQLSEGPFAAEVVDEKDQLIWSHLLIAQPRIINIVGP